MNSGLRDARKVGENYVRFENHTFGAGEVRAKMCAAEPP